MVDIEEAPPEPEKDRSERWLLTYADLITLLLIFFVIMYVMSKQDTVKYQALATSLNQAFKGTKFVVGNAPGPGAIPGGGNPGASGAGMGSEQQQMESLEENIDELAQMEELDSEMTTSVGDEGVTIRLNESMMFTAGRAELSAQAQRVLREVGGVLARYPKHQVRVEGHTDPLPISNAYFPSNWELSSARAASVVRTLVSGSALDSKQFWVAGYAEFRPIADNRTDVGRRTNRRVEIVVLRNPPPTMQQVAAEAARPRSPGPNAEAAQAAPAAQQRPAAQQAPTARLGGGQPAPAARPVGQPTQTRPAGAAPGTQTTRR